MDVLLRDLLGELTGEADGPQRLEEEEEGVDADSQEKAAELEELFHDMGECLLFCYFVLLEYMASSCLGRQSGNPKVVGLSRAQLPNFLRTE